MVWVTQAGGPAWLADTGLALDADGFIAVDEFLRSSDPRVFAAGDVAAYTRRPLEGHVAISFFFLPVLVQRYCSADALRAGRETPRNQRGGARGIDREARAA